MASCEAAILRSAAIPGFRVALDAEYRLERRFGTVDDGEPRALLRKHTR
jgi:hypothetical protein